MSNTINENKIRIKNLIDIAEKRMDKRATTNEQKREVIERLYKLWTTGDNQYLRLGQLIENTRCEIYYKEDYELLDYLEDFYNESED